MVSLGYFDTRQISWIENVLHVMVDFVAFVESYNVFW